MVSTGSRAAAAVALCLLLPPLADAQNAKVLWDTHHGVYSPYTLTGKFTTLVAHLQTVGIDVVESSAGVLSEPLSSYDVIVVSALNAHATAYTPAEAQAIHSFAAAGGGVLLIGDNPVVWPQNMVEVAKLFDMTFSVADLTPSDALATDLAAGEEMFEGITSIYGKAGGEVAVGPQATVVGRTAAGQAMIVRWNHGAVVGMGDGNAFDDSYIHNADNVAYAKNLFTFLAAGCVESLGPGTPGTGGVVPVLSLGSGSCQGMFALQMSDAVGGATALLLAGTQAAEIPAAGGTVYVDVATPPFVAVTLPLGGQPGVPGAGSLVLAQNLTAYLPLTLTMQVAVFDAGAAHGVALSNGVLVPMAP